MRRDATAILYGLPGVRVRDVVRDQKLGRVVHVLTEDPDAAACPQCGVISASVRQRRTTRPRDLPYGQERLAVRWHKTQWACRERACPRKAFTEQIPEIPARARVTGRLRRHVAGEVGRGLPVSVAADGLLSWPIAHAGWVVLADAELVEPGLVVVLGIDETRRGRPVWVQSPETGNWRLTERFETNFVDLGGGHGRDAPGDTNSNGAAQGYSGRPLGGPAPPSPPGWTSADSSGRTRCGWWRSTRARPTARRCRLPSRTRSSSPTTSTSCGWRTRRSPTSAAG